MWTDVNVHWHWRKVAISNSGSILQQLNGRAIVLNWGLASSPHRFVCTSAQFSIRTRAHRLMLITDDVHCCWLKMMSRWCRRTKWVLARMVAMIDQPRRTGSVRELSCKVSSGWVPQPMHGCSSRCPFNVSIVCSFCPSQLSVPCSRLPLIFAACVFLLARASRAASLCKKGRSPREASYQRAATHSQQLDWLTALCPAWFTHTRHILMKLMNQRKPRAAKSLSHWVKRYRHWRHFEVLALKVSTHIKDTVSKTCAWANKQIEWPRPPQSPTPPPYPFVCTDNIVFVLTKVEETHN